MIFPSVGSSSRVSSLPVVVLPQPDSPTSDSVSPRRTVKSRPSTACTAPCLRCNRPRRTGKYFCRPVTVSSSALSISLHSQFRLDVGFPRRQALFGGQVAGHPVFSGHPAQLRDLVLASAAGQLGV